MIGKTKTKVEFNHCWKLKTCKSKMCTSKCHMVHTTNSLVISLLLTVQLYSVRFYTALYILILLVKCVCYKFVIVT